VAAEFKLTGVELLEEGEIFTRGSVCFSYGRVFFSGVELMNMGSLVFP